MAKKIKKYFLIFLIAVFSGGFSLAAKSQTTNLLGQPAAQNQNVDFFIDWSAQTFVPGDYQGKSLPTFNSIVKLTATPAPSDGQKINENNYSFNWIIDNFITTPSQTSSESFKVNEGKGNEHKVYLRIFDKNRDLISEKFFIIPIAAPDVVIYKANSDGALGDIKGIIYASAGSELSLTAKPFFFNNILNESHLLYVWRLNGEDIKKGPQDPNKITIVFPPEIPTNTEYSLTLVVENPFDLYQFVEKNYTIIVK